MLYMVMTLEVSKLSGLLNADASCRVERRAHAVQGKVYGSAGGGWRVTTWQAACRAALDCRFGAGQGEERTSNMKLMSVTLEVSKLSSWLNDDAACREPKEGHTVWGEVCGSAG